MPAGTGPWQPKVYKAMKTLLCLCLSALLSGCLPIGIRGQNLPLAGQPASHACTATGAAVTL